MSEQKTKILCAMSGGVDSSVAAALLLEAGYDVIGAFMKNWSGCDWEADKRVAMRVAASLGIELHVFDFEKEYRERVYEYMIAEYDAGRTPNPDVMCNSEVKFDLLMKVADDLGCENMATGHYARVEIEDGQARLLKGVDGNKDQSYFLCRLGQDELMRSMFPVGELEKPAVRKIAEKYDLVTADKKDSQGLCFIGPVDLPTFLKERIKPVKGNIVSTDGEVVGEHEGVQYYTIGQRHGLGVGGGAAWYVVDRKLDTNELVVGHDDDPALYSRLLEATELHWVSGVEPKLPLKIAAHIRYRQDDQACKLSDGGYVKFEEEQRAIAPGQFIVFYIGDELVGSGVIK
ncbi:tRNA 2-thiouridine(34) synthase MnmA [Candidatus Uhrbacteria bacterium]|nr:tRNA 2-thiouridine(34) synthase MnmA [Candidatus Uhrbacteria bacterium]